MSKYNKLWGYIGGSLIGVLMGIAAYAGLAECEVIGDPQTCSAWGLSYTQIVTTFGAIFGAIGVYQAPKNAE